MPKSLLWWLLSLSLLVLAGCGVSQSDIVSPTEISESWDVISLSWSEDVDNPIIYINEEYGFQITLPKWREEYREFVYHIKDTSNRASAVISIALPTTSTWPGMDDPQGNNRFNATKDYDFIPGYASVYDIVVYTHSGYYDTMHTQDSLWNEDILPSITIYSGDNYVYVRGWPQDMPLDLIPLLDNKQQFQDMTASLRSL